MANVPVKNSLTGTMGNKAAKRSRFEKLEVAYGLIPSTAFAVGDTLIFNDPPMRELIKAELTANGEKLEVFHGADLSSAVAFDILNDGSTAAISYVLHYIRGTGKVNTATAEKGEGVLLKVTVASGASA